MLQIRIASLLIGVFFLSGCTQQEMARNYGGTETITLGPGRKLVNLTWKESHLWILTRGRRAGETAETYEFKENSSFGVIQGTVIVKEQ